MFNEKSSQEESTHYLTIKGKKLLTVYYRHKPGGLCKRMYMMFDAWIAHGGEIHYIASEEFPVSNTKIIPHILWTPFENKEGLFFWCYFISVLPFYVLIVVYRYKIDIVSVFSGIYGFLSILVKILLKKPIVAFARADVYEINKLHDRNSLRVYWEDLLMGSGFRWSNHILSVSQHLKEALISRYRIDEEKITVLNNHIQVIPCSKLDRDISRKKLGLAKEDFVLVSVAVLGMGKNIEVLIKAGHFNTQSAVFFIVGEGSDRARLELLAAKFSSNTKFIFTGWKEDVSGFLLSADLFVLPSKYEGCSNALLEALSYGIPCLGSDVAGNREVLESELLLFDPDDEKALSDKIDKIIKDRKYLEQIKTLTWQARKRFIFDWDRRVMEFHCDVMYSNLV